MSQDSVFLLVGDLNAIKHLHQQDMIVALADPQSLNAYAYANENPLRYKDPSGNYVRHWWNLSIALRCVYFSWRSHSSRPLYEPRQSRSWYGSFRGNRRGTIKLAKGTRPLATLQHQRNVGRGAHCKAGG